MLIWHLVWVGGRATSKKLLLSLGPPSALSPHHDHCCCRVWSAEQRLSLCEPVQVFRCHVAALTTDEQGRVWIASGAVAAPCPCPAFLLPTHPPACPSIIPGLCVWAGAVPGALMCSPATCIMPAEKGKVKSYKLEYKIPRREREGQEGEGHGHEAHGEQEQQEPEEEEEEGQGVWTLTKRGELLSYVKGQPAPDYRVDGAPPPPPLPPLLCCDLHFCGHFACPLACPLVRFRIAVKILLLYTINPPVPGLAPTVQRSQGRRWSGARWLASWPTTARCAA